MIELKDVKKRYVMFDTIRTTSQKHRKTDRIDTLGYAYIKP